MIATKSIIQQLEYHSRRAWPALETRYYDGWVLRFAGGYTRRANSVHPIYGSSADLVHKLSVCEKLYGEKNLPPRFKLTDAAHPDDLEDQLVRRGYTLEAHTSVQTLALERFKEKVEATIEEQFSTDWLDHHIRLHNRAPAENSTMQRMLERIAPRTVYAAVRNADNEVLAVGMAVLDGETIGLFDIVTDSQARGQGLGQQITKSLLAWGKSNGATLAYLQVMRDNYPAQRLYTHLGFQEVYQYWYRVLNNRS